MPFSVRLPLIFALCALLLPGLVKFGLLLERVIATEPLCYMRDGTGNMRDLTEICGVGNREISVTGTTGDSQSTARAQAYTVTNSDQAVTVGMCITTGEDGLRYIQGDVRNRTEGTVSEVVVRYQVIELREGGAVRVARRSGLPIETDQIAPREEGWFVGTKNKFNISDGLTEVLGVEWRDSEGRSAEFRYDRPRRCQYDFVGR